MADTNSLAYVTINSGTTWEAIANAQIEQAGGVGNKDELIQQLRTLNENKVDADDLLDATEENELQVLVPIECSIEEVTANIQELTSYYNIACEDLVGYAAKLEECNVNVNSCYEAYVTACDAYFENTNNSSLQLDMDNAQLAYKDALQQQAEILAKYDAQEKYVNKNLKPQLEEAQTNLETLQGEYDTNVTDFGYEIADIQAQLDILTTDINNTESAIENAKSEYEENNGVALSDFDEIWNTANSQMQAASNLGFIISAEQKTETIDGEVVEHLYNWSTDVNYDSDFTISKDALASAKNILDEKNSYSAYIMGDTTQKGQYAEMQSFNGSFNIALTQQQKNDEFYKVGAECLKAYLDNTKSNTNSGYKDEITNLLNEYKGEDLDGLFNKYNEIYGESLTDIFNTKDTSGSTYWSDRRAQIASLKTEDSKEVTSSQLNEQKAQSIAVYLGKIDSCQFCCDKDGSTENRCIAILSGVNSIDDAKEISKYYKVITGRSLADDLEAKKNRINEDWPNQTYTFPHAGMFD